MQAGPALDQVIAEHLGFAVVTGDDIADDCPYIRHDERGLTLFEAPGIGVVWRPSTDMYSAIRALQEFRDRTTPEERAPYDQILQEVSGMNEPGGATRVVENWQRLPFWICEALLRMPPLPPRMRE
jgi:hypothetical protein